jgi:hypothetical protein
MNKLLLTPAILDADARAADMRQIQKSGDMSRSENNAADMTRASNSCTAVSKGEKEPVIDVFEFLLAI